MKSFIKQIYQKDKKCNTIVFIDRDGTINKEVDYLHKSAQLTLLPTVVEAIKLLNKHNILVIVITNQPAMAKGLLTKEELKKINNKLHQMLKEKGATIHAIYTCPHHPNADLQEFRTICFCRKPNTFLFESSVKDFFNRKPLCIIGDRTADVASGVNLMIPSIVVKTGYKGEDKTYAVSPTFSEKNLFAAAKRALTLL